MKVIKGVQIFSAGNWNGDEYTTDDLDDMVNAFSETSNKIMPHLKLGHDKDQNLLQKDGLPAAGWIGNLYRNGEKLMADFIDIPEKIYKLIENKAYRKVSSEILWNARLNSKLYKRALSAVSLLGADMPAVQNLDDILALYGIKDYDNLKAYNDKDSIIKVYDLEIKKEYGASLARFLNNRIEQVKGEGTKAAVIQKMASAAGIDADTVEGILDGKTIVCPPLQRLQGFAKALGVGVGSITSAASADGCKYNQDEKENKMDLEKELEKEKEEKKALFTQKEELENQVKEYKLKVEEADAKAKDAEQDKFVNELVAEKLASPAMKPYIKEVLSEEKKEYSVKVKTGEKEEEKNYTSKGELLKEALKLHKASFVNLDENSEEGKEKNNAVDEAVEIEKLQKEYSISAGEAYRKYYDSKKEGE